MGGRRDCLLLLVCFFLDTTSGIASFGARETKSQLHSHDIDEVSGLAISRVHPNVAYVHNDKGDSSRIFAIDLTTGSKLATYEVQNARNYDWEDVTIGPCADDCRRDVSNSSKPSNSSSDCLYIADTGDHGGDGAVNIIYMVREPNGLHSAKVDVVQTLQFKWHEQDAESLMISPDCRLFVISKVKGGHAKMAQLPASGWGHVTTLDMTQTATLSISTHHKDPQGGDIATNGKEMLLVCEDAVYYYSVLDGDFLNAVRNVVPTKVQSYNAVPSTEAISWTPDSLGFYVIPEGKEPHAYFYPREGHLTIG